MLREIINPNSPAGWHYSHHKTLRELIEKLLRTKLTYFRSIEQSKYAFRTAKLNDSVVVGKCLVDTRKVDENGIKCFVRVFVDD
jgi:hypothetical protein